MTPDALNSWIQELVNLCQPQAVHYCDGSQEEYDALCQQLVEKGTFIPLNSPLRPRRFLCRSAPQDVSRVEDCTFICSIDLFRNSWWFIFGIIFSLVKAPLLGSYCVI